MCDSMHKKSNKQCHVGMCAIGNLNKEGMYLRKTRIIVISTWEEIVIQVTCFRGTAMFASELELEFEFKIMVKAFINN